MKAQTKPFEFQPFSKKQKKVLTWWMDGSPHKDKDMIICVGAIRAGKTISLLDSFFTWSLSEHSNRDFIISGKSIGALKRNVVEPMKQILAAKGFPFYHHQSENYLKVGSNTYYLVGAPNEKSQDIIQGELLCPLRRQLRMEKPDKIGGRLLNS